jgi:hypothetical protein
MNLKDKLAIGFTIGVVLLICTAATVVTGFRTATELGTNDIAIIDYSKANGGGVIKRLGRSNLVEALKVLPNWPVSGESNTVSDAGSTNATKIGLAAGKSGVAVLVKTVEGGWGLLTTNQGSNVVWAVDASVIATLAQLNAKANTNGPVLFGATMSGVTAFSGTNYMPLRTFVADSGTIRCIDTDEVFAFAGVDKIAKVSYVDTQVMGALVEAYDYTDGMVATKADTNGATLFNVTLSNLGTNAYLRLGAGGIVSTGKFGAGLSLAADGTMSASGSGDGGVHSSQFARVPVGLLGANSIVVPGTNAASLSTNGWTWFSFVGTPTNGARVALSISNVHATANILVTNSSGIFDATVGSNVTLLTIQSNSLSVYEFAFWTNDVVAGRWHIVGRQERERELTVSGAATLSTNVSVNIDVQAQPPSTALTNLANAYLQLSNQLWRSTNAVVTAPLTNAASGEYTNTMVLAPGDNYATLLQTNATLRNTNFSGLISGMKALYSLTIQTGPGNVAASYNVGALHGLYWGTNANAPLWGTLTNGKRYEYSVALKGTNAIQSIILVE